MECLKILILPCKKKKKGAVTLCKNTHMNQLKTKLLIWWLIYKEKATEADIFWHISALLSQICGVYDNKADIKMFNQIINFFINRIAMQFFG